MTRWLEPFFLNFIGTCFVDSIRASLCSFFLLCSSCAMIYADHKMVRRFFALFCRPCYYQSLFCRLHQGYIGFELLTWSLFIFSQGGIVVVFLSFFSVASFVCQLCKGSQPLLVPSFCHSEIVLCRNVRCVEGWSIDQPYIDFANASTEGDVHFAVLFAFSVLPAS